MEVEEDSKTRRQRTNPRRLHLCSLRNPEHGIHIHFQPLSVPGGGVRARHGQGTRGSLLTIRIHIYCMCFAYFVYNRWLL